MDQFLYFPLMLACMPCRSQQMIQKLHADSFSCRIIYYCIRHNIRRSRITKNCSFRAVFCPQSRNGVIIIPLFLLTLRSHCLWCSILLHWSLYLVSKSYQSAPARKTFFRHDLDTYLTLIFKSSGTASSHDHSLGVRFEGSHTISDPG